MVNFQIQNFRIFKKEFIFQNTEQMDVLLEVLTLIVLDVHQIAFYVLEDDSFGLLIDVVGLIEELEAWWGIELNELILHNFDDLLQEALIQ